MTYYPCVAVTVRRIAIIIVLYLWIEINQCLLYFIIPHFIIPNCLHYASFYVARVNIILSRHIPLLKMYYLYSSHAHNKHDSIFFSAVKISS